MNKNQEGSNNCKHTYIVCLGSKEKENYNYCLDCHERVYHGFYGSFVIDASEYLEDYQVETKEERIRKLGVIKEHLESFMEKEFFIKEEGISLFKTIVEEKREQKIKKLKIS